MSLEEAIETSPVEALPGKFWMYKYEGVDPIAAEAWARIQDSIETTLVVLSESSPGEPCYGPLSCIRMRVSKPFAAPGFLAAITEAVGRKGVNVLVLSTFSFDYIFVKQRQLAQALEALVDRGFPRGSSS